MKKPKKSGVKTDAELAAEIGITRQMLGRYRTAGCVGATVEEINAWRAKNLRSTKESPGGPDYKRWRARREKYVARQAKLDYERERGELLAAADVRRELVEWAVMLRMRIVAIPDEVSAVVPQELKATVKRIAEASIRQGLKNAYEAAVAGDERIDDLILAEAERIKAERARGE